MNLRLAKKEDSPILFSWRNDESAYCFYLNPRPVSLGEHTKWYEESLSNPNRQIYLAEVDGEVVGMIRVDKEEGGCELSWVIDSGFRGKGYGRQMLQQIIVGLSGYLRAQIKSDNTPSIAMVQSLGFERISPEGSIFSEWVLEK